MVQSLLVRLAMGNVKVVWAFIEQVGFPMLVLTLASAYVAIANHSSSLVFLFFWFKLLVDALLFYGWTVFREHEIYYYYNLGIRKRLLFGIATILDLCTFLGLHFIVNLWQ